MKIGIITPAYNGELTITKAIASAKNAANNITSLLVPCTHYIYDDASTDQTRNLALNCITHSLENFRINVITGQTNQGQAHARNVLIKQALEDDCTHIAFLDADDSWDKNHLSICIDTLAKSSIIDIIYSKPKFIMSDGFEGFSNIGIPREFIGKHLEIGNFIWISSVFAKIECFKNAEFDDSLNSLEDYDMWCNLYKKGYKFLDTKVKTAIYLVNSNSEASKAKPELLQRLRDKNGFTTTQLNLHVACGQDYQPDYINTDLYPAADAKIDAIMDAKTILYDDNSLDTLRALHVIEHFNYYESIDVLKEWCRALKPGGKLIIETPDLLATCKRFVDDPPFRLALYGHLFAVPWIPGQTHKFLFTEEQLSCHLDWAGFTGIKRIMPVSNYVANSTVEIFLAMEAYKK